MAGKNKNKKVDLKKIEKDLLKFWEGTKTYLKKAADDSSVAIKKGEKHLKTFSEKSKLTLEVLILKTRQENIYTQLGKAAAKSSKGSEKKIKSLRKQINNINREVAAKRRKIKAL